MSNSPKPQRTEAPLALVMDGILDGRVLKTHKLNEAVQSLSNCGAGNFRLEITGGRFVVLPEETEVAPEQFDYVAQGVFLDRLQHLADSAQPGSVETNLRCKMIYEEEVAETLFRLDGNQISPLTRRRPRESSDKPSTQVDASDTTKVGQRRKTRRNITLLLLAAVLVGWNLRIVDLLFATPAEEIELSTGPFSNALELNLESRWGTSYVVVATRGPSYPRTPKQLATLIEASRDLSELAAFKAIGNGSDVWVQLLDADGSLLFTHSFSLHPLLLDASSEVGLWVPCHRNAKQLTLSLVRPN